MRTGAIWLATIAMLVVAAPAAEAKGCLKGAAIGAVAGHIAHHHAILGAIAGCAIGHHMAVKQEREKAAQQKQLQKAPTAQAGH